MRADVFGVGRTQREVLSEQRAAAERCAQESRPASLVAAARVCERVAGRERDGVERDDLRALVDRGEVVETFGVGDDRLAVVEVEAYAGHAALFTVELPV